MRRRCWIGGLAVVAALAVPSPAHADLRYSIRGLNSGIDASASAINSWGVVVGYSRNGPFLWRRSTGTRLLARDGVAWSINDRGDVIGDRAHPTLWLAGGGTRRPEGDTTSGCGGTDYDARYVNGEGLVVGQAREGGCEFFGWIYTWQSGTETDLYDLGEGASATGVDTAGDIVGTSGGLLVASEHQHHGFIYHPDGQTTWLDGLGGSFFGPGGVNRQGTLIVGSAYTAGDVDLHAVVWNADGTVQRDLTPQLTSNGTAAAAASAVNDRGDIIGWVYHGNGATTQNLLWHNGHRYLIERLIGDMHGWSQLGVNAINDRGVMVGSAVRHGQLRAVILVPRG